MPAVRTDPLAAAERAAAAHEGATAIVTYRVPVPSPEAYLTVRETLLTAGYRRLLVRGDDVRLLALQIIRNQDEHRLSDDFVGGVAFEALCPGVPARHVAFRVEHVDGVVSDRLNQQTECIIALQDRAQRGEGHHPSYESTERH